MLQSCFKAALCTCTQWPYIGGENPQWLHYDVSRSLETLSRRRASRELYYFSCTGHRGPALNDTVSFLLFLEFRRYTSEPW